MEIESNENILCVDVDDTLVMWFWSKEREDEVMEFNNHDICLERLVPNHANIKLLKEFKRRGWVVIVWSQNGPLWVQEVVKKLGLESWVDRAMIKPKWIIDDLAPTAWTRRTHLDLEGNLSSAAVEKVDWDND